MLSEKSPARTRKLRLHPLHHLLIPVFHFLHVLFPFPWSTFPTYSRNGGKQNNMEGTDRERNSEEIVDFFEGFLVSLFIMIAFTFVPSGWISFIVREREMKCKHQQVKMMLEGKGMVLADSTSWRKSFLCVCGYFCACIISCFVLFCTWVQKMSYD